MARLQAILGAVSTAVRRDFKTVGSFSGNNLFVAGLTFLFLSDSQVFVAISGFIAVVLFLPLSADPLRVLPGDRLSLWPLGAGERRALRLASLGLNPVAPLVLALAVWKRTTVGLCAVAAGAFAIGFVLPWLPAARKGMWRRLPAFPGRLNHLVRKNLREMLSTLDFWCSVVVAGLCLAFRAAGLLPPAAFLPLTILIMLALSTYSQTLFGLDGAAGMMRYRLLPVAGWQILAAKDAPFLLVSVLMTLPLAPGAGLAAALAALATGHHASVTHHSNQVRWRFSSGVSFGASLLQILAMGLAAGAVHAMPALLLVCAGAYAWSAWWCGHALERVEA